MSYVGYYAEPRDNFYRGRSVIAVMPLKRGNPLEERGFTILKRICLLFPRTLLISARQRGRERGEKNGKCFPVPQHHVPARSFCATFARAAMQFRPLITFKAQPRRGEPKARGTRRRFFPARRRRRSREQIKAQPSRGPPEGAAQKCNSARKKRAAKSTK